MKTTSKNLPYETTTELTSEEKNSYLDLLYMMTNDDYSADSGEFFHSDIVLCVYITMNIYYIS